MVSTKKANRIIIGVGIAFFVIGVSMGVAWPYIFDAILKEFLQLKPNSFVGDMWMDPPIPAYLEIYLFNFSNSDEFRKNMSIKPRFEEIGPYIFKEERAKVDVVWNDNYTVTFNQSRTWYFLPDESVDISLPITNLNAIPVTVAYFSRFWNIPLYYELLNAILNMKEDLFVTAEAQVWMFDGIQDPLLDIFTQIKNVTDFPIPYDRFGWFYDRNGSSIKDGIYNIHTGVDSPYNLGKLDRWNHWSETPYFTNSCSVVHGSTGELFPKSDERQNTVAMFASDICSTLTLTYSGPGKVDDLPGDVYQGGEAVFDNGTLVPENECFGTGETIPSGARNLSDCAYGTPTFLSMPHFYLADPSYSEPIEGMMPDKDKHEFSLTLQPEIGIPIDVRAQMQMNLLLQPFPMFDMFKEAPRAYIPMLWMRQRARLSSYYTWLMGLVLIVPQIGMGVFYGIGGIGFIMVFARFIVIIRRHNRESL